MTAALTTELPIVRLPWAATVASLIAFAALFVSEGGSIVLPILAIALLLTYRSSFRLEGKTSSWIVRIVLWGIILGLALLRPTSANSDLYDARRVGWIGEMFAAELVIQMWRRRPEGGHRGIVTILLSGLVFGNACNVYETGDISYVPFITPLYALFLALALRQFRRPAAKPIAASINNQWQRVMILLMALALGFINYFLFHNYRAELTSWGMQILHEKIRGETRGMSWNPELGETFGDRNSDERVLTIVGKADVSHLRGMAFDTYRSGKWEPRRQTRALMPVSAKDIPPGGTGAPLQVTRLVNNNGILFVPLNLSSLDTLDGSGMIWSRENSGPIVTEASVPSDYSFTVGPDNYQGPLAIAPNPDERLRLLKVPPEVDSRVKELALQIGGSLSDPLQRAKAIETYLLTHHQYSLRINPGPGDPISNFLLKKKAAHCEYFASAMVILSRCLNVPARYVVGYYGHESEDSGTIVVRQRDAHAWAECWIEGQGWITMDATPGDGRPDQNTRPISPWIRFRERLQDFIDWMRGLVSGPNGLRLLMVLLVAALFVTLWQWRRQKQPPKPPKARVFAYTAGLAELTALFARFEASCRKQGLACPPGQTWQEYLMRLTPEALPTGFDREQALQFVRTYNAARFGDASAEAISRLQEMLPRG